MCGRYVSDVLALRQEFTRDLRHRVFRNYPEILAFQDDTSGLPAIWLFTQPSHPAHPAVACRKLSEAEGGWASDMALFCRADAAACARLEQEAWSFGQARDPGPIPPASPKQP